MHRTARRPAGAAVLGLAVLLFSGALARVVWGGMTAYTAQSGGMAPSMIAELLFGILAAISIAGFVLIIRAGICAIRNRSARPRHHIRSHRLRRQ
jgi:membrane protein DedA with SNARE-associated domain